MSPLLLAPLALAQEPAPLTFHRGPALVNARVLGMGATTVAAGELADGSLGNPAALVDPGRPHLPRLDLVLAAQAVPALSELRGRERDPAEPALLLSPLLSASRGRWGAGVSLVGHGVEVEGRSLRSWLLGAGLAMELQGAPLTLGGEVLVHRVRFEDGAFALGAGLDAGLRWRPEGSPIVWGMALSTPVTARPTGEGGREVLIPARLGLGLALTAPGRRPATFAMDLVVTSPVDGAVPAVDHLIDPASPGLRDPLPGASPRVGVDWEAVPGWVRLRGGGYWEPGLAAPGRAHATAGLDLGLPLPWPGPPWLRPGVYDGPRITIGVDKAAGYQRVALAAGLF